MRTSHWVSANGVAAAVIRQSFLAIIAIVGSHCLTFLLIKVLPSTAELMLGLYAAKSEALSELTKSVVVRSYAEMLSGLTTLDFGVSADGLAVADELSRQIMISLPRLVAALALAMSIALIGAYFVERTKGYISSLFSYLLFFPVYGVPLVLFTVLLGINARLTPGSPALWLTSIVAIAIPPSAMLTLQALAVMKNHLSSPHSTFWLLSGISRSRLRLILLRNVIFEITPSFEKVMTSAVTGLMFSEMILGLPGLGTLTVRAVRRADVELLLGVIVILSTTICTMRILSATIVAIFARRR